MLVEADAVIAEFVHLLPGFEVLGIGAHRDVGLEVAAGERVGELASDLEMVELFAIGEQVEDEDFHGALPGDVSSGRKLRRKRLARQAAPKNSTYVEMRHRDRH